MSISLGEKLGITSSSSEDPRIALFKKYGVLENPFPPSHKTAGNPRQALAVDDDINNRIRLFLRSQSSQVVVVTGTQGLGKTNLLEYYQRELSQLLSQDGYYVVRYYTDPEPEFGAVVRRIFQELGVEHLKKLAQAGHRLPPEEKDNALQLIRTRELRDAFRELMRHGDNELKLLELSKMLLDFLMGLRIYKRHADELQLQQRLDTTESKTQALHDVMYLSYKLGVLKGLFLFLDELEKVGGLPIQSTTRYLSAIRALIDAMPQHLCLMLAMTPDAHSRYTRDAPALGGRLQDIFKLQPLSQVEDALALSHFYLTEKRNEAKKDSQFLDFEPGANPPLEDAIVRKAFQNMLEEARQKGSQGVTQRAFLDYLHDRTERVFDNLSTT